MLRNGVKLFFPRLDHMICVFTDASELYCSGIFTEISKALSHNKVTEQENKPTAIVSGKLAGAQILWTTYGKEAFAIVQTFERMDHVLWASLPAHVFYWPPKFGTCICFIIAAIVALATCALKDSQMGNVYVSIWFCNRTHRWVWQCFLLIS